MASISDSLHRYVDAYVTMEVFTKSAGFAETWFKSALVCIAATWLTWRIYRVTIKPVDELVSLLGLEVPAAPSVSLAAIKADGVSLQWKPPDPASSVTKHHVHVNGINIGEVAPRETNVNIYALKPDHSYTVRVIASNANFQSASNPVRFMTLSASEDSFGCPEITGDIAEQDDHTRLPTVKPCKTPLDPSNMTVPPAPLVREHSGSISQKQRSPQSRRTTPVLVGDDPSRLQHQNHDGGKGDVSQLNADLERVTREVKDAEIHERLDSEDYEQQKTELADSRDQLRHQLNEKEAASRELRKEVKELERLNTSKTQHKSSIEKKLQQKHNDRKKMRADILRWDSEIEKMQKDVEDIASQRKHLEGSMEAKLEEMRQQLTEKHTANRLIEDENKDVNNKTKELEKDNQKEPQAEVEPTVKSEAGSLHDHSRVWEEKLRALQARYTMAWNAMLQAETVYNQSQQHLDHLQQRRLASPQLFSSTPTLDPVPVRRDSNRTGRAGSGRSDINSPGSIGFTSIPPAGFNPGISSGFSSTSPFFNVNNGMSLEQGQPQNENLSQAQIDALTGGAPMSPSTAGALLPSDLLADDADQPSSDFDNKESETSPPPPRTRKPRPTSFSADSNSFNVSNRNSAALPGLGTIPGLGPSTAFDPTGPGVPSSPVSVDSQPPSVFASPKDSSTNLSYPPGEAFTEFDRRSVRSNTGSSRGAGGVSRFAGILGLGARGKSLTDQGPTLGSLKGSQTQSLPRQDQSDLEPIGSRRRGSHSGPSWIQPISNAFSRNASGLGKDTNDNAVEDGGTSTSRRLIRPFAMLGRSGDSLQASALLNRTLPARQSSTNPSELPRPSSGSEHLFGWPTESMNQRGSPLGPDWGSSVANSYSRQTSRRPSLLGPDLHQLDGMPLDPPRANSQQPPIGTRPVASQDDVPESDTAAATPPRLNPAAPSFNLFRRSKKADETEKDKTTDKNKSKDKPKDPSLSQPMSVESFQATSDEQYSPPESRKSKDTRSISTLNESVDLSNPGRESLERAWSATTSEPNQLTPSGTPISGRDKETFMQKLSRKTSGSKFKAPFSKENKGFFGSTRRGPPTVDGATPDEVDEDSGILSRSVDSVQDGSAAPTATSTTPTADTGGKGSRSSGRWGSLKLSRKKDRDEREPRPGIADSLASDTGDEEDVPSTPASDLV